MTVSNFCLLLQETRGFTMQISLCDSGGLPDWRARFLASMLSKVLLQTSRN